MPVNPVMFVMAPGGDPFAFSEHLGTAFLRAVLQRAGIGSFQYLPGEMPSLPQFASWLREARPAVVGFTVYEANLYLSRLLAKAVRAALPETVVLVGGPNATFSPAETLDLLGADACLRGAGEGSIAAIADRILGSARPRAELPRLLADLPNLLLATPEGPRATRTTQLSSFPEEHFASLDELPSPYQMGLVRTPALGYLTARGCDQHCTFCSFAAVSGHRIRFHSVGRVLDDLEALARQFGREGRPARIQIFDDAFTIRPGRAREICEGILERSLNLELSAQTRADRVDPSLLRLMRRAGFTGVCFGIESGSPRVLRAIGKVRSPKASGDPEFSREKAFLEDVRAAVAAARDAGLQAQTSVIRGLPTETPEDFRATSEFVGSLDVYDCADNVLVIMPGTPLYEDRGRFGLRAGRDPATLAWRTDHAFDVEASGPVPRSTIFDTNLRDAQRVVDALCGRCPGPPGEAVWAVVAHGVGPVPEFTRWVGQVLAIGGVLLILDSPEPGAEPWRGRIAADGVPYGTCRILGPDSEGGGYIAELFASSRSHRFTFLTQWDRARAEAPFEVDAVGACRVSIGIASSPNFDPRCLDGGEVPFLGPGLQVADACRWRPGTARCRAPRVLHAFQGGAVRPCWNGPRIGTIGDTLPDLLQAARRLPGTCPLGGSGSAQALGELDLASQLSWLFPPRRGAAPASRTAAEKGDGHETHE